MNPVAALIECYRHFIFGVGSVPYSALIQSALVIVCIFALGLTVFNRVQKNFIDTV